MKIDAGRNISLMKESSPFWKQGAFVAQSDREWWIGWGDSKWSAEPKPGRLCFYLPDFFLENKTPWLVFSDFRKVSRSGLIQELTSIANIDAMSRIGWKNANKEIFAQRFLEVQKRIASGAIEKAVPLIFFEGEGDFNEEFVQQRFKALTLETLASPYGFWKEGQGMVGATPERLFHIKQDQRKLETMALAGTGTHSEDLLQNRKERIEHQLVIDDLRRRLEPYGRVDVGETYEWKLRHLKHLRTDIDLWFQRDFSFEKWVAILHPTPALGVYPRESGWEWLRDLNYSEQELPFNRLGAPFGILLPNGDRTCLVSIRQIQWRSHQARIGVGCGIVAESQYEKEWSELQLKQNSIREALSL